MNEEIYKIEIKQLSGIGDESSFYYEIGKQEVKQIELKTHGSMGPENFYRIISDSEFIDIYSNSYCRIWTRKRDLSEQEKQEKKDHNLPF